MSAIWTIAIILGLGLTISLIGAYYRLLAVLNPLRTKALRHGRRNPKEPTHLLIVLGSGGHTAEMIGMLKRATSETDPAARLNWQDFTHRTWVVGLGDGISAERAKQFEDDMREQQELNPANGSSEIAATTRKSTSSAATTIHTSSSSYEIISVPRARAIHQPLSTTPISALECLHACLNLLTAHTDHSVKDFPDLILCNGPATATILVFASVLLRFFNIKGCATRGRMRTIYVESWARVNGLSLSGKLLCRVVDRFLVQWPQLEADAKKGGGRAEFVGVLV